MSKLLNYKELIAVIISVAALFVSVFSYKVMKSGLEYQVSKDSFEYTPALREVKDTSDIVFSLNNNAVLQSMKFTFPPKLQIEEYIDIIKPISINIEYLCSSLENYIRNNFSFENDKYYIGTVSVPVLIDYSAIVYGDAQDLREYRLLIFQLIKTEEDIICEYKNSFLMKRYGFPLKGHYFFKLPFSDIPIEKIVKQDRIDILELLNHDFTIQGLQ